MADIEYVDVPNVELPYSPMDALSDFVSSGINAYFAQKEEEQDMLKSVLPSLISAGRATLSDGDGDFSYGGLNWNISEPTLDPSKLKAGLGVTMPDYSTKTRLDQLQAEKELLMVDSPALQAMQAAAMKQAKKTGQDAGQIYSRMLNDVATERMEMSLYEANRSFFPGTEGPVTYGDTASVPQVTQFNQATQLSNLLAASAGMTGLTGNAFGQGLNAQRLAPQATSQASYTGNPMYDRIRANQAGNFGG